MDSYDSGRAGIVYVTKKRWWQFFNFGHLDGVRVAIIDLNRHDAEEQIAEARAKALSLGAQLEGLENI